MLAIGSRIKNRLMIKKCLVIISILLFSLFNAQQKGVASWYGNKHSGKKTANGEIFNENNLTCASNTHKLGTKLKVTNLENGKSVVVRVTDRGGFTKMGRVLDLSKGAFAKIANVRKGVVKILVEVID